MNGSMGAVGRVALGIGTSGAKRQRGPRVAPVARAVRAALAVSAVAFAFTGSGAALAGDCTTPVDNVVRCNGDFTDTINFAVEDLTLVVGDASPSTVVPAAGDAGILADWSGDIGVTNLADISTLYADGIHAYGSGDIHVDNGGSVESLGFYDTIGVYAYSGGGDVAVHNDGSILAYSYAGLADGIFASGANVEVGNAAEGSIAAYGYDWAAGIEAQGSDAVAVGNHGDIYARTYGVGEGFGIYASGGAAGASVDNSGSISVRGYDSAVGIYATASGSVDITNSGDVLGGYAAVVGGGVFSSSYASGILALSGAEAADIAIDNTGTATAISFSGSAGIEGRSLGADGTVAITNSGEANAYALSQFGGVASGIAASAMGDAAIDNTGGVFAYSAATAYGAIALSFNGDASVVNSGDIEAVSSAFVRYSAFGAVASSSNGAASVDNSGTIDVITPYVGVGIDASGVAGVGITNSGDVAADGWVTYGVRGTSGNGDVSIDNSGSVATTYSGAYYTGYFSFGIQAETVGGDIGIDNSGDVSVDSGRQSLGIFASSSTGDISVDNSGSADAYSIVGLSAGIFATNAGGDVVVGSSGSLLAETYAGTAAGAFARASAGTASISNSGDLQGISTLGAAYGVLVRGMYSEGSNSGDIAAQGDAAAFGVYAEGVYGASVSNSGGIEANAAGSALGVYAYSYAGGAGITNAGDITAEGAAGIGVGAFANGYLGATVSNSGSITGAAGPYGTAIGVYARAYGDVLVDNSGVISATHDSVGVAVQMESAYGVATLDNSGTIEVDAPGNGAVAVVGSSGANEIRNTGHIDGAIVTFAADDSFANGNGGTWLVGNGTTYFGGGDDGIDNGAGGTIHLANGAIFLGASGAGGNSFRNAGTIRTSDFGLIDMGAGASALENDGVISFVDGAPDDMLYIAGDLGGDGAINLDVSLLNGTGDLLYVDGDVVDGTSQAINLAIDGLDGALQGASVQVVRVAGIVAPNAFTGGSVLNVDPGNFVDLGVAVAGDGAGGFRASVEVAGLNDAGVVAGSVANGAHSLINSSIGTSRQRMGLAPVPGEGDVGLGPWIRAFSDQGDVGPDSSGFGGDRNFGFSQENTGTEFGMNLALGHGISFGVMGGKAEGTQELGSVNGSDRIELRTSGLYAGWSGTHLYADVSWRWMDFDARLASVGGGQRTSGNATAFNIETGYKGWTLAGANVVPQVQYTRSVIDNVDAVQGSQLAMEIHGGVSERVRAGISLDRSFAGPDGFTWTPYGALSAVREMDGNTGYTIADRFSGRTSTSGNSALAELGIGVQKGRFSATGGIHLADGDALQGFYGGQLLVRYTW